MIRKTTRDGRELVIETTSLYTCRVTLGDTVYEECGLARIKPVMVNGKKIVWAIALGKGTIGLSAEEGDQIATEQKQCGEAARAAYLADPECAAWDKIEAARENLNYWTRRADRMEERDDTGRAFAECRKAQDALTAAKDAYLAEFGEAGKHWASERRAIAREEARRKSEFKDSFIGRGLD